MNEPFVVVRLIVYQRPVGAVIDVEEGSVPAIESCVLA